MFLHSYTRKRTLPNFFAFALFTTAILASLATAAAQTTGPVLISQAASTRALSFESVTQQPEPFATTAPIKFGVDQQTRIMLFAMNLTLQTGDTVADVSVAAEDSEHHIYQLPVEYVGSVPAQPWATSVVVRLSYEMNDLGDVLVG